MLKKLTITAFLVLLAAALFSAAAQAKTGAIVFSMTTVEHPCCEVEGKAPPPVTVGGLYASKDGNLNRLTEDPTDSEPDFSADGHTIAFVRGGDVYAMRADGTGQRQLT